MGDLISVGDLANLAAPEISRRAINIYLNRSRKFQNFPTFCLTRKNGVTDNFGHLSGRFMNLSESFKPTYFVILTTKFIHMISKIYQIKLNHKNH